MLSYWPACLPANILTPIHPCANVRAMRPQIADLEPTEELSKAGFRFGDKGTHTSRTIMLSELSDLLATEPIDAERTEYASAIIDDNVLGKQTMATRRLTNQRLGELYGLNRRLPLFRTLRRLWAIDEDGRPLMALLKSMPAASTHWRGEPRQWDGLKNWRRHMKGTLVRHGNGQSQARNAS